jgi:L-rhamnose 1-dehydrogenase
MGLLYGKTVMVTGGSSGIGRGIALVAAREGAQHVWIADLTDQPKEGGKTTVEMIRALGGQAEFVPLDVSDPAGREAAMARTEAAGGLDIMVCNAGISMKEAFLTLTPEQFERMKAVNLDGVLFCAQAAARQMVAAHRQGSIVVIASIGGLRGSAFSAMYSAIKAGLINLTSSMADALGPSGIRVNAVCPGVINTSLSESQGPEFRTLLDMAVAKTPLRRAGEPEDIGEAVAWLASSRARFVNGVALPVDGGLMAVM